MKSILQPRIRDFVSWQLEHYYQNRQQLEKIKRDLIPSATPNYSSVGGHSSEASRSTEDITLQITSSVYVQQLEKTVNAIGYVLGRLDPLDTKLITLVFFDGTYTVEGAAQVVNLSRTAAYNHVNSVLVAIALELGLINAGY